MKAVVIRVDSPGGSALASDLMWREIRALSKEKPVIASMVDVAASGNLSFTSTYSILSCVPSHSTRSARSQVSHVNYLGGYYIAMACDEIVAEELTITGSIGVVSSKFNAKELNDKIGFGVDAISRGRYAEVNTARFAVFFTAIHSPSSSSHMPLSFFLLSSSLPTKQVLSTSRGFTEEEDTYFADSARKAYVSFITKAAASRNMTVDAMNEVKILVYTYVRRSEQSPNHVPYSI